MVQQALDLQHLRSPEEGVDPVLVHLHLPGVHEGQQEPEVLLPDVPEDDDRVLTGVTLKKENKNQLKVRCFSRGCKYISSHCFHSSRCEVANI